MDADMPLIVEARIKLLQECIDSMKNTRKSDIEFGHMAALEHALTALKKLLVMITLPTEPWYSSADIALYFEQFMIYIHKEDRILYPLFTKAEWQIMNNLMVKIDSKLKRRLVDD